MIRSSKFTLKFLTQKKKELLDQTFDLYKNYLQKTIDLLWDKEKLPNDWMNTVDIDWMDTLGGTYKQLIYQHASQIVRSCKRRKGKKSKPKVKNVVITFDQKSVKVEKSKTSEFDKWIRLRLPFVKENRKQERVEIKIPLKDHKHSLKFKDWEQRKSVRIDKKFVTLIYKKETPQVKETGKTIGIDQGYKNLITTSEGQFIGKDFDKMYKKISRKKQGSKAFKRSLIERDGKVNELINEELDLTEVKQIKIENLKNLKTGIKGRFRKEFNNKLQRWCYCKVVNKLERFCQENRVLLDRVDPAYTSQTCLICRFRHSDNRKNKKFKCLNCGYKNHADIVGAINISSQEVIIPDTYKKTLERSR